MTHIMIDLETMSLRPNAAIVSIGAVLFDDQGCALDTFYRNVSLSSCQSHGLHIDAGTVMWWLRQNAVARDALDTDPLKLPAALRELNDWMPHTASLTGVWGNGAAADNVWLAEAYLAADVVRPWTHKHDRCYRTFRAAHQDVIDPPENETSHNALSDALWQVEFMRIVIKQKGVTIA